MGVSSKRFQTDAGEEARGPECLASRTDGACPRTGRNPGPTSIVDGRRFLDERDSRVDVVLDDLAVLDDGRAPEEVEPGDVTLAARESRHQHPGGVLPPL